MNHQDRPVENSPNVDPNPENSDYAIEDLLDMNQLNSIFNSLFQATGLNIRLKSYPGLTLLASTVKTDVCADFLRKDSKSARYCYKHNLLLTRHLTKLKEYKIRICPHGLAYGVTPVIIKGRHIADFYIGPFLLRKKNTEFVRKQAMRYDFDADAYIEAIKKVPVFKEKQIVSFLSLLAEIANMFALQMLQTIHVKEVAEKLAKEIVQHKQTVKQLKTLQEELERIFNNSQVGIMLLQGNRFLSKANQRLADILGYDSPNEMLGISMRQLHVSEEKYIEYGEKYYQSLVDGEQIQIEFQLKRKDNTPVWCTLSGKAIDTGVPPDLEKGVLWMVDDITQKKAVEQQLKRLAITDPLTNLFNRRHFFELAQRELALEKRYGNGLSLMMIDADHFKSINDTYGHHIGDMVLKALANAGRDVIRKVDIFARVGGEEFAVLLPHTTLAEAADIAERFRETVAAVFLTTEQVKINFTVSIGVSSCSEETRSVEDLLRRADIALYTAKNKGRNRVVAATEPL